MKIIIPVIFFPLLVAAQVFPQDPAKSPLPLLKEGDRHWDLRAEGAQDSHAASKEIDEAIANYRRALVLDPDSLSIRWRLMRAMYFKGKFGTNDNERKKTIFDDGKAIGEEAIRLIRNEASLRTGKSMDKAGPVDLGRVIGDSPDVAATFLWLSANWGEWTLASGKLQAVRQGVATKIRDLALAVSQMDPTYAEGGGYRVLGRLYHQVPYIPFITSWASTKEAVGFLRRAYEIGPQNSYNRLYLAEALWDLGGESRKEARMVAEALIWDAPRPAFLIEDRWAMEQAQMLIEMMGNEH